MKRIIQKFFVLMCSLILFYGFVVVSAYALQDKLLYKPTRMKSNITVTERFFKNMQEVTYELPEGKQVYAWYHAPERKKKIVVFFHGNAFNLEKNIVKMNPWIKAGYGLFAPEYEGFGGIKGELRQAQFETDAKAALAYLNKKGYANQDIILYGHSLGTYMATYASMQLGQNNPFNAVILEAPFFSLLETAKAHTFDLLPLSLIMKDTYPTFELIDKINTRVFIAHGKQDKTIPYNQGIKLFEKASHPKIFYSADKAGHNNLPDHGFIDAVLEWL